MITLLKIAAVILLSVPTFAIAQAIPSASPPPPGLGEMIFQMLPMIGMMFVIFYVLVTRPQQRKMDEHEKFMKELKKGDEVFTSGGLIAKVVTVDDSGVSAEIAPGVKVKFQRSAVLGKV